MHLYIAGPLFTPYHRAFHRESVRLLRAAGHSCFVPQEEEHNLHQLENAATEVFQADLRGLRQANAVVALLDDPDVSSGTACELGIFLELARQDPMKIGILGILTDDRPGRRTASNVGESLNFFTLGCVLKIGKVCRTIEEVLDNLAGWQEELDQRASRRSEA